MADNSQHTSDTDITGVSNKVAGDWIIHPQLPVAPLNLGVHSSWNLWEKEKLKADLSQRSANTPSSIIRQQASPHLRYTKAEIGQALPTLALSSLWGFYRSQRAAAAGTQLFRLLGQFIKGSAGVD